jgi:hypothetical protein
MGEHEAPHVGFAIRAAPGSDGSFWEFITAAGQRSGGREYCTAAHKTYEGTAAGVAEAPPSIGFNDAFVSFINSIFISTLMVIHRAQLKKISVKVLC